MEQESKPPLWLQTWSETVFSELRTAQACTVVAAQGCTVTVQGCVMVEINGGQVADCAFPPSRKGTRAVELCDESQNKKWGVFAQPKAPVAYVGMADIPKMRDQM